MPTSPGANVRAPPSGTMPHEVQASDMAIGKPNPTASTKARGRSSKYDGRTKIVEEAYAI